MATNIDLGTLSRYLESDVSPDDCMGLSKLDGFLTGIIAGPEPIPTDDWLPAIWGEATPSFQSTSARETIIGLIMGRHKEIAAGLNADPEEVEPIFDKGRTGERNITDWAAGFLAAIELRRTAWEPLFSHRRAKLLVEPLVILGADASFDDERDPGDRWKEFYTSRPDVIRISVGGIHDFWRDYRERQRPRQRRVRGSGRRRP